MKNKILTSLQILLILVWAVASYVFGGDFNLFVFNILPIPNLGLMILTIFLILIGYWLQGMKNNEYYVSKN